MLTWKLDTQQFFPLSIIIPIAYLRVLLIYKSVSLCAFLSFGRTAHPRDARSRAAGVHHERVRGNNVSSVFFTTQTS